MKRILCACIILSGTAMAVEKTSAPCDTTRSTTSSIQKCRPATNGSISTIITPRVINKDPIQVPASEKVISSKPNKND